MTRKSKPKTAKPKPAKINETDFWRGMAGELNVKTVEEFDTEVAALGGTQALMEDPEKFNALMRKITFLPKLPSERVEEMLQRIRERLKAKAS